MTVQADLVFYVVENTVKVAHQKPTLLIVRQFFAPGRRGVKLDGRLMQLTSIVDQNFLLCHTWDRPEALHAPGCCAYSAHPDAGLQGGAGF